MKKLIFILYILFLHLSLIVLILNPDIIMRITHKLGLEKISNIKDKQSYRDKLAFQKRIDENVPDSAIIFIGDSITEGLCVASVADRAINYGIGRDTTEGVLERIPYYQSLKKAKMIVLAIGINDLLWHKKMKSLSNYKKILSALPEEVPVALSAILPVEEEKQTCLKGINQEISTMNQALLSLCKDSPNCYFIDSNKALKNSSGQLEDTFHIGDGLHLSPLGYAKWIESLRKQINRIINEYVDS